MHYEIDFMPVGESHGDAICMRYWMPDGKFSVDVIDGGYAATGEDVVRHLSNYYGTRHVNNLILTHSDTDHAAGLIPIMKACSVDYLYMNLPWLYVDYVQYLYNANYRRENLIRDIKEANEHLVQLLELAEASRHTQVLPIFQDTIVGCMTVLAPSFGRYVTLIPSLRGPDPVRKPKPMPTVASVLMSGVANVVEGYLEEWGVETLSPNPDPPTSDSNETSVVQRWKKRKLRLLLLRISTATMTAGAHASGPTIGLGRKQIAGLAQTARGLSSRHEQPGRA